MSEEVDEWTDDVDDVRFEIHVHADGSMHIEPPVASLADRVDEGARSRILFVTRFHRFSNALKKGWVKPEDAWHAWGSFSSELPQPREDIRAHPKLFALHDRVDVRCVLADWTECPGPVLRRLARDQYPEVRVSVAENPAAGRKILEKLLKLDDRKIECAIAMNAGAPSDLLAEMYRTSVAKHVLWMETFGYSDQFFRELAMNPNTPPETLDAIECSGHIEETARILLSENPNTPAATIVRLADFGIRTAVASPKMPKADLVRLATSDYEPQRVGVAENPNVPRKVLKALSGDGSCEVRVAVAEDLVDGRVGSAAHRDAASAGRRAR